MSGLSINDTPFQHEVAAVLDSGKAAPCFHFDLELHVKGQNYKPLAILGYRVKRDFLNDFYPVYAIEIQTTGYIREVLIENMSSIEATLKTYEIGRQTPYSMSALQNPKIRKYKAKLYLAESDYISQDNFAVNNEDYMKNKSLVVVQLQLVEKGFEQLHTRYVGGTYRGLTGAQLLAHLIDFHANRNNDDVNSLINGVDIAPNASQVVREFVNIEDGVSLVEAMHIVNEETGGIYSAGFSYFIHNNIWYIYPPYSLNRFNQTAKKLIIVNLPKNKLPGIEKTYNDVSDTLIVLSTRDATVKDKRESKRILDGIGVRFADAAKLLTGFSQPTENKLNVNASQNVNDLMVEQREDGTNFMRFGKTKITAAKNMELSRLAPSRGFMVRLSWENSKDGLIYPGMPVKLLYLKRNQTKSAVGSVVNVEDAYYAVEEKFPPDKFATLSYIDIFVNDETDDE